MNYTDFISYSTTFQDMKLNDILILHKNYMKTLSAIRYYFSLNSIDDVKISEITEEQYRNITNKIIFD